MYDSARLDLAFAKPNGIMNTDLLIICWNCLSLIWKTQILYLGHLCFKHSILYVQSLSLSIMLIVHCAHYQLCLLSIMLIVHCAPCPSWSLSIVLDVYQPHCRSCSLFITLIVHWAHSPSCLLAIVLIDHHAHAQQPSWSHVQTGTRIICAVTK